MRKILMTKYCALMKRFDWHSAIISIVLSDKKSALSKHLKRCVLEKGFSLDMCPLLKSQFNFSAGFHVIARMKSPSGAK